MGNIQMEADQIRYKGTDYKNVQTALAAALESSGSATLAGLDDTTITEPSNGQVLTYDGTAEKWKNATIPAQSISGLSDTAITTPTNGQVLAYDSTAEKWVNTAAPSDNVYSTTETKVGTYDGLDLYRKIYKVTNMPNNGTVNVDLGLSRLTTVIRNISGIARISKSDWATLPLPYVDSNGNIELKAVEISGNMFRVNIKSTANYYEYAGEIVVEYTKITESK